MKILTFGGTLLVRLLSLYFCFDNFFLSPKHSRLAFSFAAAPHKPIMRRYCIICLSWVLLFKIPESTKGCSGRWTTPPHYNLPLLKNGADNYHSLTLYLVSSVSPREEQPLKCPKLDSLLLQRLHLCSFIRPFHCDVVCGFPACFIPTTELDSLG